MAGRNLSLEPRKVAVREKNSTVEVFDLNAIEEHFNENLAFITGLFVIADKLMKEGNKDQAKEIWRSQLVLLDSAFDFYMHEVIKSGLVNIFHGDWPDKTEKFQNLSFSMDDVEKAIADTDDDTWLKEWINIHYANQTLMSYECFKDSCNLLGLNWKSVADYAFYQKDNQEKTEDHLKRSINSLFYRRNRIAHQMDRKREDAERQDISKEEVNEFIHDIRKIIDASGKEIRKLENRAGMVS